MAIITTGSHPKALWPGIKAWWGRNYDKHPDEFIHLFDMEASERNYEEDVQVTGFGLAPVKAEGNSVYYDQELQGYVTRYTHVAYSLGYIVTFEEMQDNLYEMVSKRRAEALAFSMKQTKEIVAANVYNRGFNASYTFGDGQALMVNTHPTVYGNQANILSTSADISEAAIEDMATLIMQTTNDRGLRISLMPRMLIVPPTLWYESNRIMKSVLQNDTANNAVNVLKAENVFPEGIKINHYLTDVDGWFIRTNAPRGMIGYDRHPIEFTQDNDFDTSNAKAKCYERYSFGATDWRGVFGSPGS